MTTSTPTQPKKTPATTSQPVVQSQQNGTAIAALVLGILSIAGGFGLITGIPAIIFAIMTMRHKNVPGRGMAVAGLVTGIIGTILSILMIALVVFLIATESTNPRRYIDPYPRYKDYSTPPEVYDRV